MSQGSEGSPVLFLDPAACDDILADLRGADGRLPSFSDDSEPGIPPPTLEAEETHSERATQTSPVPTHHQSTSILPAPVYTSDQATQVIGRPHQATSFTQTLSSAPTSEQSTQVLLRPPRSVAYTQTATAATSTRTSWTQVPRPLLQDAGTDSYKMPGRPPPGFKTVDLTADTEEDDMNTAPATPPPTVSDSEGDNMETDEEADNLASPGNNSSSSDSDDGFQHV